MRILFLIPYPLGVAPSQRFRFEQYFDILMLHEFQYEIQSFWSEEAWKILYKEGYFLRKFWMILSGLLGRFQMLRNVSEFDFVFIHREVLPLGPPFFEWWISKIAKKKIVFDFDDAIWLPNTSTENRIASLLKWHQKTESICRWSHKVSCGNDYLANYARKVNPHVILNPTTIDTQNLHVPPSSRKKSKPLIIGWTGTHSTLKYIEMLMPTLKRVVEKYPQVVVQIIADKQPSSNFEFVRFINWSKESEISDLSDFDIGIMPLQIDTWAEGKCGFKALQYMALGIPTIASPVGVNLKIIDKGINGFLCETESEWITTIGMLLADEPLRTEIGKQGRKKVIDSYSVRSNTSNFLSLFE